LCKVYSKKIRFTKAYEMMQVSQFIWLTMQMEIEDQIFLVPL